jgi:hypothetical protein
MFLPYQSQIAKASRKERFVLVEERLARRSSDLVIGAG